MSKNRNCIVKKLCEDNTNFEYGIDQNASMYIKKKDSTAWEPFWEKRLTLKKEKNANVKTIYTHASGIQFGINKQGEFYKRKERKDLWTAFSKKEEVPIIFDIGHIIATKADHYWVEYEEETIIKYQVLRAKKRWNHIEGYDKFVVSDTITNEKIIEKVVFDNSSIKKSVDILLNIK